MGQTNLRLIENSPMDKRRRWTRRSARSRRLRQGLDHEARRRRRDRTSRRSRPARSGSTSRSASAACRAAASSRSTARNRSGKTTLALHVVAEAQKKGGVCAFIDAEHALDPVYARKLGVNIDELLISQPDTGEQALEIAETLVRSGAIDVLVIDSVAALVPRAEIEGEMGDAACRAAGAPDEPGAAQADRLNLQVADMVIFINQIRMKIGVMFGNPETTTGGNALKFYASVRLDIRRIGAIKDRDEVVGNRTRVKVVKNKVAPPFKAGRVRHHVRRGHLEDAASSSTSASRPASSRSAAPGSPMTASASARAAKTPRRSSRTTPTSPRPSRRRSGPMPGSSRERSQELHRRARTAPPPMREARNRSR